MKSSIFIRLKVIPLTEFELAIVGNFHDGHWSRHKIKMVVNLIRMDLANLIKDCGDVCV
jgi:hypothetical protein